MWKLKDFILNLIYPAKCPGCGAKDNIFCGKCIYTIRKAEREIESPDISAVFDYRDQVIKKVIWELKYHKKRYLGEKLGEILYDFLVEEIGDIKMYAGNKIIVIPVPISLKKKNLRGYNQALHIARGFCKNDRNKNFELKSNIVFKKSETMPQARITNRKRRLENVRGVFGIKNEDIIKGRTVIIIDDVTTTGGTIGEIIKILKKAGAKKVIGFAVAH